MRRLSLRCSSSCGSVGSIMQPWIALFPRILGSATALLLSAGASAQDLPGEGRRLDLVGVDVTQDEIASGSVSLSEIRRQGQLVFSVPFSKADGYGDGPGSTRSCWAYHLTASVVLMRIL